MSLCPGFKAWSAAAAFVTVLLVCGCNTVPVAQDIDQRQALEIVALLNSQGLGAAASKERQGYSVMVRKSAYPQAVSLIKDNNLPSEAKMSFRQLVGEQGIIPSSREIEALRLDHALAVEIEDMLENHAAISEAKAVVRLNFRKDGSAAGISAVLKERAGAEIPLDQIVGLILAVVPGVARENVQIAVTPEPAADTAAEMGRFNREGRVLSVPLVPFLFWRVPENSLIPMAMTCLGVLLLALLVGTLVGYGLGAYRHARGVVNGEIPEDMPLLSLKIDRNKRAISSRSLSQK